MYITGDNQNSKIRILVFIITFEKNNNIEIIAVI